MFKLQTSGKYDFKWLNKIKTILLSTGFSNLWQMQDQYDTKYPIFKHIPPAIKESIVSVTQEKIQNGSRCTNYKIYKQNLNLEFYLTNLSPRHRNIMSKFRCGYNRLPVNDFRFLKSTDTSEKHCRLCDQHEIGDEYHYLFCCPFFVHERKMYLKKYFISHPNTQKMCKLFNSKSKMALINLAKFQAVIMSHF